MKRSYSFSLILLALVFLVASCQKEPQTHKGQVSFNSTIKSTLKSFKSVDSTAIVKYALVEIQNNAGEIILSNEKIDLTQFGDNYLSEPLAFNTGSYQLTKFILVNDNNVAVYATPVEGSEKAYLVENPLPIEFEVSEDVVTKVSPEVIDAIGQTAQDFGYSTFSFNVVETFDILVAAFVYNEEVDNFELTSATISVKSGDDIIYNGNLQAITNQITLKSGLPTYTLTVEKSGYITYIKTFSEDSIKSFFDKPLTVILKSNTDLNAGLFAWYPFSANFLDSSENHFDATNYGCAYSTDRFGKANSALSFNGYSSFIVFPDEARFVPYQSTTLSFWIKTGQTTRFDLFNQRSGDHDPSYYNHGIIVNRDSLNQIDYRFPGYTDGTQFTTSGNICDNTWHLVTFIKDCENNVDKVYVDEELVYTWNLVDSNFFLEGQLILGKEFRDVYFFNGLIDDVRIYHRALTGVEVKKLTTL